MEKEPVLVSSKELNNENGVGNIFFGNYVISGASIVRITDLAKS
ncbi:MAG: hypothetical protein R2942_12470 [Ignavibacteria bacterium]